MGIAFDNQVNSVISDSNNIKIQGLSLLNFHLKHYELLKCRHIGPVNELEMLAHWQNICIFYANIFTAIFIFFLFIIQLNSNLLY